MSIYSKNFNFDLHLLFAYKLTLIIYIKTGFTLDFGNIEHFKIFPFLSFHTFRDLKIHRSGIVLKYFVTYCAGLFHLEYCICTKNQILDIYNRKMTTLHTCNLTLT